MPWSHKQYSYQPLIIITLHNLRCYHASDEKKTHLHTTRKAIQPKGVVNDASARRPNLPSALCDFDFWAQSWSFYAPAHSCHFAPKYCDQKFGNRRMNEWMDEWLQVENTTHPPASLGWQRQTFTKCNTLSQPKVHRITPHKKHIWNNATTRNQHTSSYFTTLLTSTAGLN